MNKTPFHLMLLYVTIAFSQIPPVPSGHPRVYMSASDIPAIQEKIGLSEFSTAWTRVLSDNSPLCYAFRYLIENKDSLGRLGVQEGLTSLKACTDARTPFNPMHVGACIYDWCYSLLSSAEKNEFISEFQRVAGLHSPGYPAREGGNTIVGHDTEAWLMSDQLPAGIAIYDELKTMYDSAAALFFNKFIEPRNFLYPAHVHHQGDSYIGTRLQHDQLVGWLFRKLGAGNIYVDHAQFVPYQIVYHLRPDSQQMRSGDTYDDRGKSSAKRRLAMYAGTYYNDPYLMTLADSRVFWSFGGMDRVFELIFREKNAQKKPLDSLPLTKYFPHPMGEMVARTGWQLGLDSPDAVVHMRIGNYFFGNHQRKDFGTFQIYYKGPLAIASGVYEGENSGYGTDHWKSYYHQTIAHNGLLIFDPTEQMDKGSVNDGGQYWPNNGRDHPRDLDMLLDTANGYKMGEVRAHAFGPDSKAPDYSYISGDITAAYAPQKVSRVERSMVCFSNRGASNPVVVVVYDQVSSTNASFKKRWLLHSIQQPIISGRTITILRNESHYSGNGNYSGKLVVQSLLPQDASITRIGGPGYEFWVQSVSTNYATTKGNGAEPGAWRIEVLPKSDSLHTEFLHVLCAMDISTPPSSVEQIASGPFIGAKTLDRAVLFNREQDVPDTVDISINGTDSLGILVTGLRPGAWQVNRNGSSVGEYTATDSGGCIYFKSMAGQMQLIWSDSVSVEASPCLSANAWIHAAPNPFSRATRLQFNVQEKTAPDRLDIYNLQGRKVKTILVSGSTEQGALNYTAVWDGRDGQGKGAAPGVYLVKINKRNTFAVLKLLKID